MRLWHESLIKKLPRQQLLVQHRECAALRGRGWGRRHSVVDYVFTHEPERLVAYHFLIMDEMRNRGYNPDLTWYDIDYRGRDLGRVLGYCRNELVQSYLSKSAAGINIYPEHNKEYLQECLENLKMKGIEL